MLFTDSPPAPLSKGRQTGVSYEQNGFLVCCRNKQRNFNCNLIIKRAVPEIYKEGDEIRFGSFKVARYSFPGPIPPKFEHKLRHHKQSFEKIAITVVLDKDENLL